MYMYIMYVLLQHFKFTLSKIIGNIIKEMKTKQTVRKLDKNKPKEMVLNAFLYTTSLVYIVLSVKKTFAIFHL